MKLSLIPQTLIYDHFPPLFCGQAAGHKGSEICYHIYMLQQAAWRRDCELCDVVTADLVTWLCVFPDLELDAGEETSVYRHWVTGGLRKQTQERFLYSPTSSGRGQDSIRGPGEYSR